MMKTFSLFALMAAIVTGTVSMLRVDQRNHLSTPIAARSTDGAFRDGLYLGQLAAERGSESHLAVGRWATPDDRSSFTSGYQQGYNEFLANRVVSVSQPRLRS
jgi:hypothetical protein